MKKKTLCVHFFCTSHFFSLFPSRFNSSTRTVWFFRYSNSTPQQSWASSTQSIHSLHRSLNGILDDYDDDLDPEKKKISSEPFDDSRGFRPITKTDSDGPRTPTTTPLDRTHDSDTGLSDRDLSPQAEKDYPSKYHNILKEEIPETEYPAFPAMSGVLRREFEELEEAFGTIRRIWGQRDTQDVAYVRPDGVLVDRDGVELRKIYCRSSKCFTKWYGCIHFTHFVSVLTTVSTKLRLTDLTDV